MECSFSILFCPISFVYAVLFLFPFPKKILKVIGITIFMHQTIKDRRWKKVLQLPGSRNAEISKETIKMAI